MEGYNIKMNDYVKPTEPRREVVQRLINYYTSVLDKAYFLGEFCANNCWRRTYGLREQKFGSRWEEGLWEETGGFVGDVFRNEVRVTTCEMKEFVRIWIKAGYCVSRGYYSVHGKTAVLYQFTDKPYTNNGYKQVFEFIDDID